MLCVCRGLGASSLIDNLGDETTAPSKKTSSKQQRKNHHSFLSVVCYLNADKMPFRIIEVPLAVLVYTSKMQTAVELIAVW